MSTDAEPVIDRLPFMQGLGVRISAPAGDRRSLAGWALLGLVGLLGVITLVSLSVGASGVGLDGLWRSLFDTDALTPREQVILYNIRAPRVAMGIIVGAGLSVSGAVMQGLFRNPLADPGLVGVTAGSALGAVTIIVLGDQLFAPVVDLFGVFALPVAAFVGALLSMLTLYRVSTRVGQTSIATMLLAGIALAALCMALTGLLVFKADDLQLRELTFWNLGSLGGATWSKVGSAAPIILLAVGLSLFVARGLDRLALGEAAAHHMGVPVQRLKLLSIVLVAAATGAAVAVSGAISFVGIVVPHLLRLTIGANHRYLLMGSALLGGALMLFADAVSRIVVAPAELPIGIVTAVLGAPFFLWILLKRRGTLDL